MVTLSFCLLLSRRHRSQRRLEVVALPGIRNHTKSDCWITSFNSWNTNTKRNEPYRMLLRNANPIWGKITLQIGWIKDLRHGMVTYLMIFVWPTINMIAVALKTPIGTYTVRCWLQHVIYHLSSYSTEKAWKFSAKHSLSLPVSFSHSWTTFLKFCLVWVLLPSLPMFNRIVCRTPLQSPYFFIKSTKNRSFELQCIFLLSMRFAVVEKVVYFEQLRLTFKRHGGIAKSRRAVCHQYGKNVRSRSVWRSRHSGFWRIWQL